MADVTLDTRERRELCDLFEGLGPLAPTLIEGWTAHDLAAHLVLREHDLVAGPCLVLPGPFERFAERRRASLAGRGEFAWLVARIRSGPPVGFFRIGWVRAMANLNDFFAALWRNVCRGGRYLSRRLLDGGLSVEWAGSRVVVRAGEPVAVLRGAPEAVAAVRRTHFGM